VRRDFRGTATSRNRRPEAVIRHQRLRPEIAMQHAVTVRVIDDVVDLVA
jgi:hypothetical protein